MIGFCLNVLLIFVLCGQFLRTVQEVTFQLGATKIFDKYNDNVTMLYDGSTVNLKCMASGAIAKNDANAQLLFNGEVIDSTKFYSDEGSVSFNIRINGSTQIGEYKCKIGNENSTDSFPLSYKLCGDSSSVCRTCSADKFCFVGEDQSEVCGNLNEAICRAHPEGTLDVCLSGLRPISLCLVNKVDKNNNRKYTRSSGKVCDSKNMYFEIMGNDDIRIGAINKFDRKLGLNVTISCTSQHVTCREKVLFKHDDLVTKTKCNYPVPLKLDRFGISSFVSKLICETEDKGPMTTFMFLVNIDPTVTLTISNYDCGKVIPTLNCSFKYPIHGQSFTTSFDLLNNSVFVENKEGGDVASFAIQKSGNYTCNGTIVYKSCSPSATYTDYSISEEYVLVEEKCIVTVTTTTVTRRGGKETTEEEAGNAELDFISNPIVIGIFVGVFVAVVMGTVTFFYCRCIMDAGKHPKKGRNSPTGTPYDSILGKKSMSRSKRTERQPAKKSTSRSERTERRRVNKSTGRSESTESHPAKKIKRTRRTRRH